MKRGSSCTGCCSRSPRSERRCPHVTEPTEPARRKGGHGARAAWLVGAGIFLSRIAGLAREMVFSYYFGNSAVADAWGAALRTPNFIQNLLAEGTLSASLIPVYAHF